MVFAFNLFLLIADQFMLFLINLMVARNAGTSAFGDFTVAVKALFLIGTLMTMGLDSIIAHFIPKYYIKKKHNEIHALALSIREFLQPIYLSFLVGSLLLSAAIIALGHSIDDIQHSNKSHLLTLFVWGAIIVSIYNIYLQLFRAVGFMRTAVILNMLQTVFYFLLTLFTYFYFNDILFHNNAQYFAHIMLISLILSYVVIGILFIAIHRKTKLKLTVTEKNVLQVKSSAWKKKIFGYTIQNLDRYAFTVTPLLITEWLGNDPYEVGMFAAVITIISLGFTALSPIGILIKPEISGSFAHGKTFLFNTTKKYILIGLTIAVFISLIIGIFAEYLLYLFKSNFIEVLPYVYISLINLICYSVSMPLTLMIQYSQEGSKIGAQFTVYLLLAQIVACVIFISWLGLLGTMICYVGVNLVYLITAFIIAYKVYHNEPFESHEIV
ncbi:oligosaccharide flippase family protein [Legionella maceachernii]|uniref:Polysaccharide biosynthesis protein n=1 Tax=Legionella maceachernii TaxID=466 RepID=A0A0W0WBA4_9GAMM|nr:oligosaccharide flippase family protein [Legionella maceachernii]KTD29639.1 Polysaccharide biosynthesis protein [Legionella maceachernii]SKA20673.1 Na+-driven multidrug efflux pump [Legionella maceachernii]SUP02673.1 Polysaccharide biosynthesis protein [Legionella maceachernii]